jgi:hypothetical protein
MMQILCVLFIVFLNVANAYSIAFVHIGKFLPSHLPVTISQARLFNPDCAIYLIASEEALFYGANQVEKDRVVLIPYESLATSEAHKQFHAMSHDQGYGNLWIYSSERFFYLEEFISQHHLTDVFHLENDIMLYRNLEELLPIFQKHYKGMIGATFTHVDWCCAGIMYISNPAPMQVLVQQFSERCHDTQTDMHTLSRFGHRFRKLWIDAMPIVMPEYLSEYPLDAKNAEKSDFFTNHIDEFQSIFDGMAIGIYLGGWDSRFHPDWASRPGNIDGRTVFKSSHFTFEWEVDSLGRRLPFLIYQGKKWPINNLHLTNKGLLPTFHSLYRGSRKFAYP